jgi:hypothetical protein
MANNVSTILGLVGSVFFGPIGYVVGSFLGNVLSPQKGPNVNGPRLDDLAIQTSSTIADLPRAYGTFASLGNMIWAKGGTIQEVVSATTQKKKVLGFTVAKQTVTTYSYYLTAAITIVKVPEGATASILRVWVGDKLVINNGSDDTATALVSGETAAQFFRFYLGTDDQQPDPAIVADVGEENASGYPGILYVVVEDFPLADFFNSVSRAAIKVEYSLESTAATGVVYLGAVPVPAGTADYDEMPEQHNANYFDNEGAHVYRSTKIEVDDYTKWHFLASPGIPFAVQKRVISDAVPDIPAGAGEIGGLRAPAQGRANVNMQVFAAGFVKTEGSDGADRVDPRITIPGHWEVRLYGFAIWSDVNDMYEAIVGTPADYAPVADLGGGVGVRIWEFASFQAALDSVLNIVGPFAGISWEPSTGYPWPEFFYSPNTQYQSLGGITWFQGLDDELFSILPVGPTVWVPPFPINEDMLAAQGFRSWISAIAYGPNYNREYRIDISGYDTVPYPVTHFAVLDDKIFFAFAIEDDANIVRLANIGYDELVTITDNNGVQIVRMGIVNEQVYVLVIIDSAYELHVYDTDLTPVDLLDATEITAAFGGVTAEIMNSLSFDFTAFRWLSSGDLYTKATLAAAPVLVADLSANVVDGDDYPQFFGMMQLGRLLAVPTFGAAIPNTGVQFFMLGGVTPGNALLADILKAECMLAGVEEADIDVSLITDEVRGYVVTRRGSVRNVIQQLQACFPFDVIVSGYTLKFVPRGQPSVADVDYYDLAPDVQWQQDREMSTQLPWKLIFRYFDRDQEYDAVQQYSERPIDSETEQEIEIPIVFTPDEAAKRVDVIHSIYLVERINYGPFRLPPTYRGLEPSDVITVTTKDAVYSVHLTSVEYMPDGTLTCSGKPNEVAIYTSTAVGESPAPAVETIPAAGPVITVLMDLPSIFGENEPGVTVAMSGIYDNWVGGELWYTPDDGNTWQSVGGFQGSVMIGNTDDVLADRGGILLDLAGELTVQFYTGTLASVTEEEFYNEELLFAYGAPGRWEIIAVQNVVDNGDKNYTLSTFLRGLRGTESMTGTHQAGDFLVWLQDPDLQFFGVPAGSIGGTITARGANKGAGIDDQPDTTITYEGIVLKPLSPVDAAAEWDPDGVVFSWTRRDRGLAGWEDMGDIPMSESTLAFEVDVLDSIGTVLRTLTTTSESVLYTEEQIDEDFGEEQIEYSLAIYQMSATVGRGYPLNATVDVVIRDIPLNNLLALYDPSDITTLFQDTGGTIPVTADGQNVRYIRDKSTNGYHAAVASGATMVYRSVGGKEYLEFNATVLRVSIPAAANQSQLMACFGFQSNSTANDVPLAMSTTSGGGGTRALIFQLSSGSSIVYGNNAGITFGTHPVAINTDQVITCWFDGTQASANDRTRLRVNGVDRARTTGSVAGTTTPGSINLDFPSIAAGAGDVVGNFYGLAIYNAVLTGADLDLLEEYMAERAHVTL